MHESDDPYTGGYSGDEQLDPSEALTGDNTSDPLDPGYTVPDREPRGWRGDTADEQRLGESLDEQLAEEEPDMAEDDLDRASAEPRAGRLVAPDEGAHPDEDSDEIATDVGPAGYASSAEEAAVHLIDEDPPDRGSGQQA